MVFDLLKTNKLKIFGLVPSFFLAGLGVTASLVLPGPSLSDKRPEERSGESCLGRHRRGQGLQSLWAFSHSHLVMAQGVRTLQCRRTPTFAIKAQAANVRLPPALLALVIHRPHPPSLP